MSVLEVVANGARLVGLVVAILGMWYASGGLRVVVSGRIDERRRSVNSLKWGLPMLVVGLLLLFGGSWIANWARMG